MNIGWIGLGNMGVPMLCHVAREHRVDAYNRTPKPFKFEDGVDVCVVSDIRQAVAGKVCVFIMVSDASAVEDVLFTSGAADAMDRGTLIVNASTIGVDETLEFAKRAAALGLRYMDAPVLGSVKPANDGTLVVVAGGDRSDFDRVEPVFATFSKRAFHLGPIGQGAAMKLLVNAYLGMAVEAMAETVSFGNRCGFGTEVIFDVLETSAVWSPMLAGKRQLVIDNEYAAQFALKHLDKDLGLTLRHAAATGVSTPAIAATKEAFANAVQEGFGDLDMLSLIHI